MKPSQKFCEVSFLNNNSLAIVDVSISYETNETEIDEAFKSLFNRIKGKIPNAVSEPQLWGVQELSDSSVIYRVVVETKPTEYFATERYLRREIKKEFDKKKIKIPYTQIEVHNGK